MFLQTLKNLFNVFNILFAIHKINNDVNQIYDDAKIKSFRQNFIDFDTLQIH